MNDSRNRSPISPYDDHVPDEMSRFRHAAMATEYEIMISHKEEYYAEQAAQAAFSKLDRLEQDLSRFIENSDISRINRLEVQQSALIGADTLACLVEASEIRKITRGAFDAGAGTLIQEYKSGSQNIKKDIYAGSQKHLLLDQSKNVVTKTHPSVDIDLGAIGKGYAIDRMAEVLHEWSVHEFLIHSGYSTVLATYQGRTDLTWNVSISDPDKNNVLEIIGINFAALSGSGVRKGCHIVDPRTGKTAPLKRSTWVLAGSAARADAFSTAFMILSLPEIEKICREISEVRACILTEGRLIDFGLLS